MKIVFLLMVVFLLIQDVSATIVHGNVYDISLNRISNVIVEINTTPKQRVISQQGEYFFNVNKGDYNINAMAIIKGIKYSTSENISIIDYGDYRIDLFLFPELNDEPLNINIDKNNENSNGVLIYIILLIVIVLILIFTFKKFKKNKIEYSQTQDEDLEKIYNFIKKEKRTTQKEIRKNSSLSEAKISLIITQLEKDKKVQKIKKGRANIIILK